MGTEALKDQVFTSVMHKGKMEFKDGTVYHTKIEGMCCN